MHKFKTRFNLLDFSSSYDFLLFFECNILLDLRLGVITELQKESTKYIYLMEEYN